MKKLFLFCMMLFAGFAVIAQDQISGRVTDAETGDPLPGATVQVQGTTEGTVTDTDGYYKLEVSDLEATLVFSFVGYQPETVPIEGRTTINVQLEEVVTELDEVVVVGYGTQERGDLTSSVSTVSAEDMAEISPESVDQMIQGNASGVSVSPSGGLPGAGSEIRIRGTGTINNTQPLIVVDGQTSRNWSNQQFNPLSMINPNDIESIQILKSASATAIYGARAANGVILIETKKGTREKRPTFTYSANVGFNQAWKKLDLLNAEQYVAYAKDIQEEAETGVPPKLNTDYVLEDRTDWQDEIYRNGLVTDHNFSVTGGGEAAQYHIGMGYSNKSGHVIGHNFERYSIRANSEFDVTDHITFGETFTASYVNVDETSPGGGNSSLYGAALRMPPYAPVKDPDNDNTEHYTYVTTSEDLNDAFNPLAIINLQDNQRRRARLMATGYGEVDFLDAFTFRTQVSVDLNGEHQYSYRRWHKNGNLVQESELTEDYDWGVAPLIENTLTFEKQFGMHDITVLAGNTYDFSRGRHLGIQGRNFPNDEIRLVNVAGEQLIRNNAVSAGQNALIGYFGRVNYSLNNKYLLTFNFRRDGSAKFAEKRRWGNFPSFSLGWKLHEEGFIRDNISAISQLKIRGGWGKAGNDLISSYAYLSNIHKTNVHYVLGTGQEIVNGASISDLSSSGIRWEETATTDIGLDLGLFENRYTASFNYFDKATSGILINVPIPPSLGYGLTYDFGSPVVNEADVRNKGVEVDLGYRNMEGNFNYRIGANATFNLVKGEVESLGQGEPIYAAGGQLLRNFTKTAEGLTIGSFFGYRVDKVYSTQSEIDQDNQMARDMLEDPDATYQSNAAPGDFRFKDLNGDGQITDDDREVIGNPIPDFTYGISGWVRYGNLDLSLSFQGVQGNDIFIEQLYWNISQERPFNATKRVLDRWREPGDQTDWPRAASTDPNNNARPSDKYIDDGSFLRLRNLTLGYNFNNLWNMDRLRIFATAKNLFTITDYGWYDPEVGGSNLQRGIDDGIVPQPRTFLFGVEVQF